MSANSSHSRYNSCVHTQIRRSLWLPGSSVESPPDVVQNELFNSPASSEGWMSLSGDMIAQHPGQYILTVSAFSGVCWADVSLWWLWWLRSQGQSGADAAV